ncbi:MAG: hypothetical protein AAF368_00350, partial [Planctomycetota bacterium]
MLDEQAEVALEVLVVLLQVAHDAVLLDDPRADQLLRRRVAAAQHAPAGADSDGLGPAEPEVVAGESAGPVDEVRPLGLGRLVGGPGDGPLAALAADVAALFFLDFLEPPERLFEDGQRLFGGLLRADRAEHLRQPLHVRRAGLLGVLRNARARVAALVGPAARRVLGLAFLVEDLVQRQNEGVLGALGGGRLGLLHLERRHRLLAREQVALLGGAQNVSEAAVDPLGRDGQVLGVRGRLVGVVLAENVGAVQVQGYLGPVPLAVGLDPALELVEVELAGELEVGRHGHPLGLGLSPGLGVLGGLGVRARVAAGVSREEVPVGPGVAELGRVAGGLAGVRSAGVGLGGELGVRAAELLLLDPDRLPGGALGLGLELEPLELLLGVEAGLLFLAGLGAGALGCVALAVVFDEDVAALDLLVDHLEDVLGVPGLAGLLLADALVGPLLVSQRPLGVALPADFALDLAYFVSDKVLARRIVHLDSIITLLDQKLIGNW